MLDRIFSGVMVSVILAGCIFLLALILNAFSFKGLFLTGLAFGIFYVIGYAFEKVEKLWR
jgi:hypothetical protein